MGGINDISKKIQDYASFVEHAEEDLITAETAVKVLAIQDRLIDVINSSGRFFDQLYQPRQAASTSEITEMTTRLKNIVAYAKSILVTIEKKQQEQGRELVRSQEMAGIGGIKSIDELIVNLCTLPIPESLVKKFEDLIVRFTGGEAITGDRRYSLADINLLIELEPLLRNEPSATQLIGLVAEVRSSIREAFNKRINILQNCEIPAATMPRTNPDKHKYLCDCHDLYWEFHCPLEDQIAFTQFIQIYSILESNPRVRDFIGTPLFDENLKAKIALLDNRKGIIQRNVNLLDMTLTLQDLSALMNHKVSYLQQKVVESRKKLRRIPEVVIVGGGPGGLMRALAGGVKGTHVQVFERRAEATRANIIKLGQVSSLHYFGVLDLLFSRGKLGLRSDQPNVQIMHLEQALKEMVEMILGDDLIHIGQELVDVRVGRDGNEGPIETMCLTKATGGNSPAICHRADIIVDATGSTAAVAQILGNPREEYSKPMFMIATVIYPRREREDLGQEAAVPAALPFQDEASGWYALGLDTPEREYLQIQPDPDMQTRLMTLQTEIRSLSEGTAKQAKKAELQKLITDIAVAKARQKLGAAFRPEDIESVGAFPVQVGARQSVILLGDSLVMQSGDALTTPDPKTGLGATTAMKGATVFSKALDDLTNPHCGLGESYRNFAFGSDRQSKVIVDVAAAVRSGEGSFATVSFALNQLTQGGGVLSKAQGHLIQRLMRKQKYKFSFSPTERHELAAIKVAWDSNKGRFDIEDWYDVFEQEIEKLSNSK